MVSKRNFVAPFFDRDVVKDPASQSRTHRTEGFAFGHQTFDDRVRVLLSDTKSYFLFTPLARQNFSRKIGLLLIEIHCEQIEVNWCSFSDIVEQVEKSMTVLSAGDADHHPIAVFNHPEVGDCLAHSAQQADPGFAFCMHVRKLRMPCRRMVFKSANKTFEYRNLEDS